LSNRMRKLGDLKVPELHDELAKIGLSKKGKKAELVERLTEFIREQGSEPDEIDFDVPDVLVDIKNSSGAIESEAETKSTFNQIEDAENGDAKGGGEVVEAKEFVLTKPDSKDEQREDDEVQVIHQTDEPIPEDEKLKFEQMYPTGEPMDGFDGPIMINSSQSSQESNNTTITSTDEGEESMEIETKMSEIDAQAEKPTSRKESGNETEEDVAEEEEPQAEKSEDVAKESPKKEIEVSQKEKNDKDSSKDSSKEIQTKEPVEMEVDETQRDPGTVLLTGFREAPKEEAVFAVLEGFNPSKFVCKEIGESNFKVEVRVSSKSAFVKKFENGCTIGDDTVSASDPKYKERKRSHSSEHDKQSDNKKTKTEDKPKSIADQVGAIENDMKRREKIIKDDRNELDRLRDAEKRAKRDIEDFGRDIRRMRDSVNRVRDDCRRMRDERKNYERDLDKLKSLLKSERALLEEDRSQLRRTNDELKRVTEERKTTKEQGEREKLELERRQLAEERRRFAEERERMERERNMYRSRNRSPVRETHRRVDAPRDQPTSRDPYNSGSVLSSNYSRSASTPHPNPYDRPPRPMGGDRERRNEYSRSQSSTSYQSSRAPEYRPAPSYQSGPENGYGKSTY